MQGLVSVLLVPPESLRALVDGSLRLGHKEALRYVQLREDFAAARVDGQTLQQVFGVAEEGPGGRDTAQRRPETGGVAKRG